MAQFLPHLSTMIDAAPDAAIQSSSDPATILKWALWGCFAASAGGLLVGAARLALTRPGTHVSAGLFWTLIACFVAGSGSAIIAALR